MHVYSMKIIAFSEINRLRKNYSQVVLSPENVLSSFEEEWRGRDRLQFLLNQGLVLNFPYLVRDIHPNSVDPVEILLGIDITKKERGCEVRDYFYAGFFDLVNPLHIQHKIQREKQYKETPPEKHEQLSLSL